MRFVDLELIGVGFFCFFIEAFTGDWLAALSLGVLWLCVKLVATHDRLFVLPIAITFHWTQTTLGLFYLDILGREVPAIYSSDYRPMVLIGLGCCLALAAGIKVGLMLRKAPDPNKPRPGFAFDFGLILVAYVVGVLAEGTLATIVPDYPSFRQLIVTVDTARLGVLYLVLRRFCSPTPRWTMLALVLMVEIGLGITGFFAGFREPVVLAVLAVLEVFDKRNKRHWLAISVAAVTVMMLGVLWMGIRGQLRAEYAEVDKFTTSRSMRAERVRDLTSGFLKQDASDLWATTDRLVDRMWTVYYPALAIARVPSILPHTDGSIFRAAIVHIVTPRVFFPNKPELMSDSDMVRRYSNVHVAGRESNTSIAFGYAAEAYIDFGVPMMFLPVFGFGVFIGLMYALFRTLIWHREIFVAFGTVAFWLSVYLFERSWATMMGVSLGFMVYLGIPIVLLDRFLLIRHAQQKVREEGGEILFERPLERHRAN